MTLGRVLVTTGEPQRLSELFAFLQTFWQEAGLPPGASFPFELCLEEVFMNVVMHGTPEGAPPCRVEVNLDLEGDRVELCVRDDGMAFDPTGLASPDTTLPLEARETGGLGVLLIREMMEDLSYRRHGDCNELRMSRRVAVGGPASGGD